MRKYLGTPVCRAKHYGVGRKLIDRQVCNSDVPGYSTIISLLPAVFWSALFCNHFEARYL